MTGVLLITSDYTPRLGGVANYYNNLVNQLSIITVLTNVAGESGKNTIRTDWFWPIWPKWLPLMWLVPWWKRKTRSKLLAAGEILPIGTALLIIRLTFGWPYLVFLHGLDIKLSQSSWWKKFLSKQILKYAKGVIVNSKFTAQLAIQSGAEAGKVKIVYPTVNSVKVSSIDIKNVKSKYNINNQRVILTVSRLVRRKGVAMVIDSLAKIETNFGDLVYVIVGDGPEAELLKEESKKLKSRVIFTGSITDEEKYAWYDICEIFVLTPIRDEVDVEGFGIVYLEAQAAGKAIVASDVGGIVEAVGEAGLIINDKNELPLAMTKLLSDSAMREKLGLIGSKRINDFCIEKQGAIFYEYINNLEV